MTTTTPRIITTALLALAIAAPTAAAMPIRDAEGVQTSSLAGTTSAPSQDLRGADARPGAVYQAPEAPSQDLRNPDNQGPRYQTPPDVAPIPVQQSPYTADQLKPIATPAVADGGETSPFVYIIPALVVIAMIAAGVAFTRTSRPARRSPA
jgi:hypothetical protein